MAVADPTCPFCAAPWTSAMLDLFDACTVPSACACCIDGPGAHVMAWPIETVPAVTAPSEDIVCEACHKTIYAAFRG